MVPIKFNTARASFAWPAGTGPAAPDPRHWRDQAARLNAAGDMIGAAAAYARYMAAPIRLPTLRVAADALARGDTRAAERDLRRFLAGDRGDPVAFRMLGQVALRTEMFMEAERIFHQLVVLAPGFAPVRAELAQALLLQGKASEALTEAERLIASDPSSLRFRALKADALGRLGDFVASAALYRAMVDDQPNHPALWVSYGFILRTLRRSKDAIAAFRRAIALAPHYGEAWWNLANMKNGTLTEGDVTDLRAAIASDRPSAEDRYHLRFALARAFEEAGDHGEAFAEYKRANAARAERLPREGGAGPMARVERTIALFTPDFLAERTQVGDPAPDPIFILGMPRSGSTLLEQILSAHPEVEGTQELPDLPILARQLDRGSDGRGRDAYPEMLRTLGPERLKALGADYLARARAKRKTDRAFFLDKQPANWMHVGLIRLILPHARIIEVRRDPLACCLSMFRQHFARGAAFTYSIERLAAEYRAYDRMMGRWAAVAPGLIRRVELDHLQADFEGELRGVLDYLGLPFSDECLRFHESSRAVFTPSSEQVRRPINREADATFARFAPFVGELREALGDLAR